ncbi:cytochrome c1 [Alphaproteobacteria bacterium]|nr:cytochrome c1 [Alphaproteobacteria bacterium]MDC0192523.1 cytochrome c1 [Alphaproteobacteria bacterium]
MKIFILFFLLFFYTSNLFAAESSTKSLPQHEWSFEGITGTFDRGALQRGYQVYSEVCSGCHSMKLLYYRDLIDIGFSEDQVKAIASEFTVIDGPNDEGEMFERDARPADRFVSPYLNDNEARANNNGAYPPDLSVITKAKKDGANYIYNLLLGYKDPPADMEVGEGMYYNIYMAGNQIAMPQPIYDESVDYADGTNNSAEQIAEDLVVFLTWAAEPELEVRKNLGIKVILFFIILGFIIFLAKNRLWREVH